MRRCLSLTTLALALAAPAHALVWPDIPERVERDLSSPDAVTRRVAARQLADLGPSRGAPLVLRALADTDTEVRLVAAGSAIRLRVQPATETVLAWLGEREARLRIAACDVARAMPDPKAVPQLARALGDGDASVRAAAADALGSQASQDAAPPLLGKLDDASPTVRVQIVRSLARLGDGRAVVPVAGKVQDSVPEVRQAVARALGELGDARATQALLLELRDNAPDVRVEAIGALGRLRAPDAASALGPLASDRTIAIRLAAVTALGRIATPDAVRALIALLGQGDDASGGLERTPVRDALVVCGSAATGELAKVLERPASAAVATSAAWVLGELHAKDKAGTIIAAMRKGVLPTAAALRALAGAGTADVVPIVLEFASDPSPVVRAEVVRSAGSLLDPAHPDGRAVEPLAAALRDARLSSQERGAIAALLGRTGAPRAAPILASLTAAKDPALRLASIDALGILGPSSDGVAASNDALLERITDADPSVRLHAAVALAESGGPSARDRLLSKLDDIAELDRASLLTALGGILARAPADAAVTKLARGLELAAGGERDAFLEAIGRNRSPATMRVLSSIAASSDADDRRTVATLLPLHAGSTEATRLARALLADAEPSVRAQATWSFGALGDRSAIALLSPHIARADSGPAVNAAAAIGRIATREKDPSLAKRALCPALTDLRAHVRANALAGLALAGARCDGVAERHALESDPSDAVRASAALAVARTSPSTSEDRRALERCASNDRSGAVSLRCRTPPALPKATHTVTVYPIAEGQTVPKAHAAYALELADGTIHEGMCDRRGAALEAAAPEGEVALARTGSR